MYIQPSDNKAEKRNRIIAEIDNAFKNGPIDGPICSKNCTAYSPVNGCDRMCSLAPSFLSSEPDTYPIEKTIAPLVFEIKKLGVFTPCWSCEGHNDAAGKLWKIPRVWFYSQSVVHIRALSSALTNIYAKSRLNTKWIIEIVHSDNENPDTTFSLQPKIDIEDINIIQLHSDLKDIYTNIETEFKNACERLRKYAS